MPFTVITIQSSSSFLRGDLTKWMQEIATGVYIGNFNSKIREKVWQRVKDNIGKGQATISYYSRNELGYSFETYNTQREVIDYDGIQLVMFRNKGFNERYINRGYSDAYKYQKSKKIKRNKKEYVVLDIETNGLDPQSNDIIEIGAIKVKENNIATFNHLIKIEENLARNIIKLTGITDNILKEQGLDIEEVLNSLIEFIEELPIIGYNINFDISFLNNKLNKLGKKEITNKTFDLLRYIKSKKMYLKDYRLKSTLKEYGINENVSHRALEDAILINRLAIKVKGFL